MNKIFIIGLSLFAVISCKNENQSSQADENNKEKKQTLTPVKYTSKEIGWTIEIPIDWRIIKEEELMEDINEGKKILEKSKSDISISGKQINLISFRKNQLSKLQATAIPYKEEYKGSWIDSYMILKGQIYDVYKSVDVSVDSVSTKAEVDGVKFEVFTLLIYNKKGKLLMHQIMHRTLIKGFDFVVNITYDEINNGAEVMKAWKNSKFDKDEIKKGQKE